MTDVTAEDILAALSKAEPEIVADIEAALPVAATVASIVEPEAAPIIAAVEPVVAAAVPVVVASVVPAVTALMNHVKEIESWMQLLPQGQVTQGVASVLAEIRSVLASLA